VLQVPWSSRKRKKLGNIANDPTIPEEECGLLMAILREDMRDLERKLHLKKRSNVRARNLLEGETISKYWFELNKERTPRELITALKDPEKPPGSPHERKSRMMAAIARTYHDGLQNKGISLNENQTQRADQIRNSVRILKPIANLELHPESLTLITKEEISVVIKSLPNRIAAGMDGVPYEIWKSLLKEI